MELSNGNTLQGTPWHRVFVKSKGFIRLDETVYGDKILPWEELKLSYSMESLTGDIQTQTDNLRNDIFNAGFPTGSRDSVTCIETSGNSTRGQSPRKITSTTRMKTSTTTKSITSRAFLQKSTRRNIQTRLGLGRKVIRIICKRFGRWPLNGMAATKANDGTPRTESVYGTSETRIRQSLAKCAERLNRFVGYNLQCIVLDPVALGPDGSADWMTLTAPAHTAQRPFALTDIHGSGTAPVYVSKLTTGKSGRVFDLSIEGCHEFFANGILVHNSYVANTYFSASDKPKEVAKNEKLAAYKAAGMDDFSLNVHRMRMEMDLRKPEKPVSVGRRHGRIIKR
jgi:hypothetical protein